MREMSLLTPPVGMTRYVIQTVRGEGNIGAVFAGAMSGGWAILEVKKDDSANPLAKAVSDDFTDSKIRSSARDRMQSHFKGARVEEIKLRAIEELHAVANLVDAKAPAESQGFKVWLQHVALKAAEAGLEGGFLGFGGVSVSAAEKATLGELTEALGLPIQTSHARPV